MLFNKFFVLFVAIVALFALGEAANNSTDNKGPVPLTRQQKYAAAKAKNDIRNKNVDKAIEAAEKNQAQAAPAGTVDNSPKAKAKSSKKKA